MDMKPGFHPPTIEGLYKRVMLTLEESYPHSLDPMSRIQRLLSFSYFRGELYIGVDFIDYEKDYISLEKYIKENRIEYNKNSGSII